MLALVAAALVLAAQPAAQDPPAPPQTFRAGVDLVRIDVTVLDEQHRPVRGLTPADFTIKENGRPQRIVALDEIRAADVDSPPSAWMRYAPRDVASNRLADDLGDGQAVAIVLDDFHTPDDSTDMAVGTREVARFIVDHLGPSDLAAVVHPFKPGRTQDFTRDRAKLLDAIDRFDAEQPEFMVIRERVSGSVGGDIQRDSPALGRDPCFQAQPVIPTLRAVTAALATVPQRRKALFFVSVGLPFRFTPGNTRCQGLLYDELRRTFETAQRFNVNIHPIDPAGAAGYMRFIQQPRLRNARIVPGLTAAQASQAAHLRHDFLETLGEQTGGRPIVATDDLQGAIAAVFEEYGSYYLVGYETAPNFDGRFRQIAVTVNRRDVEVRARRGRWAPNATDLTATGAGPRRVTCVFDCWYLPPKPSEVQLTGLSPYEPLPLRALAVPVAAARDGSTTEIAAVITVRLPPVVRPLDETLTLVRTVYDANGRASPPVLETATRRIEPGPGEAAEYDVWSRFSLPPGRYDVRFNATSRLADASGSVHAEVTVPAPARTPAAGPIVLGKDASEGRADPFPSLLPVAPTTSREFARSDRITAVMRLFAPGGAPEHDVHVTGTIVGSDGREVLALPSSMIRADAFAATGWADYRLDLPLAELPSGLHLLSLTARFDTTSARRDVVFRAR